MSFFHRSETCLAALVLLFIGIDSVADEAIYRAPEDLLAASGLEYLVARDKFIQAATPEDIDSLAELPGVSGLMGRILKLFHEDQTAYQNMSQHVANSLVNQRETVTGRSLWPALPQTTPPQQAALFFAERLLKEGPVDPPEASTLVYTLTPPLPNTLAVKLLAAKNLAMFPTDDGRLALLEAVGRESEHRLAWEISISLAQIATTDVLVQLRERLSQAMEPDVQERYQRTAQLVERQLEAAYP